MAVATAPPPERRAYQAYLLLRLGFVVAPILSTTSCRGNATGPCWRWV